MFLQLTALSGEKILVNTDSIIYVHLLGVDRRTCIKFSVGNELLIQENYNDLKKWLTGITPIEPGQQSRFERLANENTSGSQAQ